VAGYAARTGGFFIDTLAYLRSKIRAGNVDTERTIQRSIKTTKWNFIKGKFFSQVILFPFLIKLQFL